jgi:leader peptidase (prepilin peptidase)/N-methyltransferase
MQGSPPFAPAVADSAALSGLFTAPALALFPLTELLLVLLPVFVVGACLGSFLNVCIARWPLELSVVRPRSRCPRCERQIRWFENIPVLSWLALRGKCSACGTRIGLRYPLVELSTALLFGALGWTMGPQPLVLLWCAAMAALLALSLIDWDTTVLPDVLTLPLLWGGIVAAALGWLPGLSLMQSVAGAAAGYLSLWAVFWLFKLTTGKEGMGYGDFKLLAALGAWLGATAILPIVLMASVLGAVIGLVMKASGSLRQGRFVPFGPFLAGGGVVVILAGLPTVLGWIGW